MHHIPSELDAIIQEIRRALDAKLYYLAIAVTLSVPDICSSLEADPSNPECQDRKTYVRWCSANLDSRFQNLRHSLKLLRKILMQHDAA
jgi:hypothetical protein